MEKTKLFYTDHRRDRSHIGWKVTDEEFIALTADELREAIKEDDGVFRNRGGELSIFYMDDSDVELTDEEFNALTADQLRQAILNTDYEDVYRHVDGASRVFQSCNQDYQYDDDCCDRDRPIEKETTS